MFRRFEIIKTRPLIFLDETSKTGLGFEIGRSQQKYQRRPTLQSLAIQSSCSDWCDCQPHVPFLTGHAPQNLPCPMLLQILKGSFVSSNWIYFYTALYLSYAQLIDVIRLDQVWWQNHDLHWILHPKEHFKLFGVSYFWVAGPQDFWLLAGLTPNA